MPPPVAEVAVPKTLSVEPIQNQLSEGCFRGGDKIKGHRLKFSVGMIVLCNAQIGKTICFLKGSIYPPRKARVTSRPSMIETEE